MVRVVCDTFAGRYLWPWSVGAVEPDLRDEVHQHDAAGGIQCPGPLPR